MSKYNVGDTVRLREECREINGAGNVENEFVVVWVRNNKEDEDATLYGLSGAIDLKVFQSEVL